MSSLDVKGVFKGNRDDAYRVLEGLQDKHTFSGSLNVDANGRVEMGINHMQYKKIERKNLRTLFSWLRDRIEIDGAGFGKISQSLKEPTFSRISMMGSASNAPDIGTILEALVHKVTNLVYILVETDSGLVTASASRFSSEEHSVKEMIFDIKSALADLGIDVLDEDMSFELGNGS